MADYFDHTNPSTETTSAPAAAAGGDAAMEDEIL
jgi:hypothetical protein